MGDEFQAELQFLGIMSSPAFVRELEGNGVAERFIRMGKEQLLWVRTFQTGLVTYNEHWLVERHDFRSPAQMRRDFMAMSATA